MSPVRSVRLNTTVCQFTILQGQSYAVPNFVEMSEDWMIRRDPKVAGQKRKEMALVTIDGVDPGEKVDENLEKEMSAFTLIHVFPVHGAFPVIPSREFYLTKKAPWISFVNAANKRNETILTPNDFEMSSKQICFQTSTSIACGRGRVSP